MPPGARPRSAAAVGDAPGRGRRTRRTGVGRTAGAAHPGPSRRVPSPSAERRRCRPPPAGHRVAGVEELLTSRVAALRVAAEAAGISAEDVERHIATLLAFLRRRLTGDYTVDEFGFDEDFTEHFYLPLLRPLYRSWFRVEVRGHREHPGRGWRPGRRQPLRHDRAWTR